MKNAELSDAEALHSAFYILHSAFRLALVQILLDALGFAEEKRGVLI